MIRSFTGPHRFLSNFFYKVFEWEGKTYATAEHAFQAAKTLDEEEAEHIRSQARPGHAKRAGRKCTLRPDWEDIKLDTMESILRAKFSDPQLRRWLDETAPHTLEEGNHWHDKFWGVCLKTGKGQNHLGKILMKIRDE